jgi:hypothetical protein
MKKAELNIIKKTYSHLADINLRNISNTEKNSVVKAKQYLSALNYDFKSSYSYSFYVLASSQPIVYETDFRMFCEKMKISDVSIDSKQFKSVMEELEKAYDIMIDVSFPRIKFTIYNVYNDNLSWNTLNFSIIAKTPGLYKIKFDSEFELSYSSICNELQCRNYENFAHFRQNVLERLEKDYDMSYEITGKSGLKGKKVDRITFNIYQLNAAKAN